MEPGAIERCLIETHKHVRKVGANINKFISSLIQRALHHDDSKFVEPELSGFAAMLDKREKCKFGSDEYNANLKELEDTLSHHYSKNRHHPEHWPNGLDDMTLVDLVEMFCDCWASTELNKDGNIRKSIDYLAKKHNMSPQLKSIFQNTIREFSHE